MLFTMAFFGWHGGSIVMVLRHSSVVGWHGGSIVMVLRIIGHII
jgi:hypothetical protein